MAYTLHPATLSDVPTLAAIFGIAFKNDHIMGFFHPHTPPDIKLEYDVRLFTNLVGEDSAFGRRWTKAVESSSGETVGFAAWVYPHHLTTEQSAEKERRAAELGKERHAPGSQDKLIDEFLGKLVAGRNKWIDPEKTFFMHILAVHPDHQGKGLGGKLLVPGLADADAAGAQTYIEASEAGLPVYLRYGWKPVDEMTVDMRPYGGHAIENQQFLMREPGAEKLKS